MNRAQLIKKYALLAFVVVLILVMGWIDYITGFEISFSVFYLIPIVVFSVYGNSGRVLVITVALLSAVVWGASEVYSNQTYTDVLIPYWNTSVRLIMFLSIGLLLHALRNKNTFLEEANTELEKLNADVTEQKGEIETINLLLNKEKERTDSLLRNILPNKIIETLKTNKGLIAEHYDNCTVLFTDFKGFSILAETMSTQELVSELNYCFSTFDDIIQKYGVEKIKTIGDSYMCVSGVPEQKSTHALDMVLAAMEILHFMNDYREQRLKEGKSAFEIRIGIHSGHLIAGVVGKNKYSYDVWGETVNSASRFESAGKEGAINISETTYQLVQEYVECSYRGMISAKNMAETRMYFVDQLRSEYSVDVEGRIADREKIYGA